MKRPPARLSARQNRAYIGFITPGLFLYTLLVIIPIACSIFYSFFEWSGIGPMKFVGLENFRYLLFGERMSGVFFNALKQPDLSALCSAYHYADPAFYGVSSVSENSVP